MDSMDRILRVDTPITRLLSEPDDVAECVNELLYGEEVEVINDNGFWGLVKSLHDGYEGFAMLNTLRMQPQKTHKVFVPATHIYDVPNFKFSPRQTLYFGSPIHVEAEQRNGFIRLLKGGWVYESHLVPLDHFHADHLETAMLFMNAPYLWGGRSVAGIDCSGLVQLALMASGYENCPRDSKDQAEQIGEIVDAPQPQRGDFVFFDGHVGIMYDNINILNATSRHMRCVIEPLQNLISAYGNIKVIRRVPMVLEQQMKDPVSAP
ncbi:MAG: hypothetical protein CBB87_03915 [Micavibrio sp. TMED27]|nr:glycoside hydrolase [Micavibrio sp.]OUT91968.1 MAG: hypothetical protein CBB87_03915 [Micavibrio sp. TMED27]|tara:strand:- start:1647 stop:2438 length:792 start_codon:yes stop_codon:yes gene_type:complete